MSSMITCMPIPHMDGDRRMKSSISTATQRRGEDLLDRRVAAAGERDRQHRAGDDDDTVGDRGDALEPESSCRIWPSPIRGTRPSGGAHAHVSHPSSHARPWRGPSTAARSTRSRRSGWRAPSHSRSSAEAVAEVPDEVADAAEAWWIQRPGIAEQDQPPIQLVAKPGKNAS